MKADSSVDRDILVRRLQEDLVGPRSSDEVLMDRPSDVYLTGILWPQRTGMAGEDDDSLAIGGSSSADDGQDSEAAAVPVMSIQKPSVAGISFCFTSEGTAHVRLFCRFARYRFVEDAEKQEKSWRRIGIDVDIETLELGDGSRFFDLGTVNPNAAGAQLHIRCIDGGDRKLATISLINSVNPGEGRDGLELATMFQTSLRIMPGVGARLVPKPTRRGVPDPGEHSDEQSAALLFRNSHEFAAGHTCSAVWDETQGVEAGEPSTAWIETSWLPSSILSGINPSGHSVFAGVNAQGSGMDPLSARSLALASESELRGALELLCKCYGDWIGLQRAKYHGLTKDEKKTAEANVKICEQVLGRMREAAATICDSEDLRHSFQLANFAMHIQHGWDPDKSKRGELRWRPFQLGFLLLSAPSSALSGHPDRRIMDLLWFPTGGGKTEAYLALIALVAFYRRLDGRTSGDGVAAIMRYTLRLLTTQQFARSTAMILACEAIRTGRIEAPHRARLANCAPFSAGLWVGGDATPNRLSIAWASLQGSKEVASPRQLANCPACHSAIAWNQASVESPVVASCTTADCPLQGPLPVWTVDDDVYRARPTLVVGTVDKFAQIVRNPETNNLFGIGAGAPPDLVIQDELHLISGPLGTVAGTYEAAFDLLFSSGGAMPKVIGSTATIRRASEQV